MLSYRSPLGACACEVMSSAMKWLFGAENSAVRSLHPVIRRPLPWIALTHHDWIGPAAGAAAAMSSVVPDSDSCMVPPGGPVYWNCQPLALVHVSVTVPSAATVSPVNDRPTVSAVSRTEPVAAGCAVVACATPDHAVSAASRTAAATAGTNLGARIGTPFVGA